MNFIAAIQHATIGYGIRRKKWKPERWIYLTDQELKTDMDSSVQIGGTEEWDINPADLAATDWEVI